jgi:hypothetical protein
LTEKVEVKTNEEDETILFKQCVNLSAIPLHVLDFHSTALPDVPSYSGSRLRATSGRKEELGRFACFSTWNPRRFVS